MRAEEETTRQRIADRLRDDPAQAGSLAREFGVRTAAVFSHVEHISKSLDPSDEQLLAAPPECRDCGFTDFDDLVNRPSRCPSCKSENVEEPTFTIE
ncbi:transcriptional regulator [Halomarina oriensis]|uniref:Transcriptional regulator n=1 Tax=Halomarina oriensis TaxID=671145 RepID=A0A6B0GSX5_9EURY|nr:transcriptional regulator [Halomarina oriensis]MWG35225.1 transcriptional regulator [Halomarina oriensis]